MVPKIADVSIKLLKHSLKINSLGLIVAKCYFPTRGQSYKTFYTCGQIYKHVLKHENNALALIILNQRVRKDEVITIKIGNESVQQEKSAKLLGILFNSFTMHSYYITHL